MHRNLNVEWERRKQYLKREMFQQPPDLSPIQESRESLEAGSYTEVQSGPIPELIVEIVPKRQQDDEPDEFYDQLEKRMKKFYKKLFQKQGDVNTSFDLDETIYDYYNPDDLDITNEDEDVHSSEKDGEISQINSTSNFEETAEENSVERQVRTSLHREVTENDSIWSQERSGESIVFAVVDSKNLKRREELYVFQLDTSEFSIPEVTEVLNSETDKTKKNEMIENSPRCIEDFIEKEKKFDERDVTDTQTENKVNYQTNEMIVERQDSSDEDGDALTEREPEHDDGKETEMDVEIIGESQSEGSEKTFKQLETSQDENSKETEEEMEDLEEEIEELEEEDITEESESRSNDIEENQGSEEAADEIAANLTRDIEIMRSNKSAGPSFDTSQHKLSSKDISDSSNLAYSLSYSLEQVGNESIEEFEASEGLDPAEATAHDFDKIMRVSTPLPAKRSICDLRFENDDSVAKKIKYQYMQTAQRKEKADVKVNNDLQKDAEPEISTEIDNKHGNVHSYAIQKQQDSYSQSNEETEIRHPERASSVVEKKHRYQVTEIRTEQHERRDIELHTDAGTEHRHIKAQSNEGTEIRHPERASSVVEKKHRYQVTEIRTEQHERRDIELHTDAGTEHRHIKAQSNDELEYQHVKIRSDKRQCHSEAEVQIDAVYECREVQRDTAVQIEVGLERTCAEVQTEIRTERRDVYVQTEIEQERRHAVAVQAEMGQERRHAGAQTETGQDRKHAEVQTEIRQDRKHAEVQTETGPVSRDANVQTDAQGETYNTQPRHCSFRFFQDNENVYFFYSCL